MVETSSFHILKLKGIFLKLQTKILIQLDSNAGMFSLIFF